jgi:hypothetical protein
LVENIVVANIAIECLKTENSKTESRVCYACSIVQFARPSELFGVEHAVCCQQLPPKEYKKNCANSSIVYNFRYPKIQKKDSDICHHYPQPPFYE